MSIFLNLDHRIRQDPLHRLRWNVLAPLEEITIRIDPLHQTIDMPLLHHPLADESIA